MSEAIGPRSWHLPVDGHGGKWDGLAGFSRWHSDSDDVKEITGNRPVVFEACYPDFSPWACRTYKFNNLTGGNSDFTAADRRLAEELALADRAAAAAYRTECRLTWHHHQDGESLLLVPRALHANVPHAGGAQMLRALDEARTGGIRSKVALNTRSQTLRRASGDSARPETLVLLPPRLAKRSWDPTNHAHIMAMLNRFKGERAQEPRIAVFDWDSTSVYGECGPLVWHFMLEHLALQVSPTKLGELLPLPPSSVETFPNGMVPVLLREDIETAYTALWPLQGNLSAARALPAYRDFTAKVGEYCSNYDQVNPNPSDGPLWMRWFTGFTPESLGKLSVQAATAAAQYKGLRMRNWMSHTAGKAGHTRYRFEDGFGPRPEIIDLQRALKSVGVRSCFVTGGIEPMVRALAEKFNYPVAIKDIIGTRYVHDAAGKLTQNVLNTDERPATYGPGKTACIRKFLGTAPVLVAGDSDGDFHMLTAFPETQARIIIHANRGGQIASLYTPQEDPLHIVQYTHPRSGQFSHATTSQQARGSGRSAAA